MKFKIENIQWGGNSRSLPDRITINLVTTPENRKLLPKTPDDIGDTLFLSIQKEYNHLVTIKSFIWYNEKNPGKTYRWIPMYEQIGPHTWRRNR